MKTFSGVCFTSAFESENENKAAIKKRPEGRYTVMNSNELEFWCVLIFSDVYESLAGPIYRR